MLITLEMRIGIVDHDQSGLTKTDCFARHNDSGLAYWKFQRLKCPSVPGLGIELIFLILELLEVNDDNAVFIPAKGWNPMPSGEGLIDLVVDRKVNLSIAQLTFTYSRSELIQFAVPVIFQSGPCFMLCGKDKFIRFSSIGIFHKLFGRAGLIFFGTVSVFFALTVARSLQFKKYGGRFHIQSALLDTVFSRPRETSAVGLLHSRFVTTIITFCILRGFFKSGLIEEFSPYKRFPFRSISHLAESISKQQGWTFVTSDPTTSYFKSLFNTAIFDPIVARFDKDPEKLAAAMEFFPSDSPALRLRMGEKTVYFDGHNSIFEFMSRNKDLDCICDPLESKTMEFHGGIAMHLEDVALHKRVNRAIMKLARFGLITQLVRKYRLIPDMSFDSDSVRNQGLKLTKLPQDLMLTVFSSLFLVYFAILVLACGILFLERCGPKSSTKNT